MISKLKQFAIWSTAISLFSFPAATFAFSISPNSYIYNSGTPIVYNCSDINNQVNFLGDFGQGVEVFDGELCDQSGWPASFYDYLNGGSAPPRPQAIYLIETLPSPSGCNQWLADCRNSPDFVAETTMNLCDSLPCGAPGLFGASTVTDIITGSGGILASMSIFLWDSLGKVMMIFGGLLGLGIAIYFLIKYITGNSIIGGGKSLSGGCDEHGHRKKHLDNFEATLKMSDKEFKGFKSRYRKNTGETWKPYEQDPHDWKY